MDELGVDTDRIEIIPGRFVKLVKKSGEAIRIPVGPAGQMYINWTKKWANAFGRRHIPFSLLVDYYSQKKTVEEQTPYLETRDISAEDRDIIKSNIKTFEELSNRLSIVKGKITITGETAESSTDIGKITIDSRAPLVLMQANIINMFRQGAFLTKLPFEWNVLISLAIILIIYLTSIRITSALRESMAGLVIIAGVVLIEYLFLALFGVILNYIMNLTSMVMGLAVFTIYKFISYDRQKNYIRKAFMQYLSPDVVRQVIENPDLLRLGGERREITAYFSDVVGFTEISEKLSPEEVVMLLNRYLTAMTDIILAYDGTVDKYEGDAIVAFFGAPMPQPDHAVRCCNAAVDMQKELIGLREEWLKEGYPVMTARMGVNTGPAIIGNMGSQHRMDYTMMGDTVNTASRLEGVNKSYGTYTMISEFTCREVGDRFIVRKLDLLRVVGKTKPIEVFELVGRKGEVEQERLDIIDSYHKALQEYRNKNWEAALKLFGELIKENDPPSRTYYDRCMKYRKTPPPDDWDGVFVLSSK
jgi:adenylate cyclase